MKTGVERKKDPDRLRFDGEGGRLEFILAPIEGLVVAAADRDGAEIDLRLTMAEAAVLGRWLTEHCAIDVAPRDPVDPIAELVRLINDKTTRRGG